MGIPTQEAGLCAAGRSLRLERCRELEVQSCRAGVGPEGWEEKEKLTSRSGQWQSGTGYQRQTEGREGRVWSRRLAVQAGEGAREAGTRDHRGPACSLRVRGTKPQPQPPGDRKVTQAELPAKPPAPPHCDLGPTPTTSSSVSRSGTVPPH